MAFLKHIYSGTTISVFELSDQTTIGRNSECNIHLEDATISGVHAQINREGDAWYLIDLGSTNGVFVGGKAVEKAEIISRTRFSIGTHNFEFFLDLPPKLAETLKIKKSWIPGVYYTE